MKGSRPNSKRPWKSKLLEAVDNIAFAILIFCIIIIAMWFVRQIPVDVEKIRSQIECTSAYPTCK